MSNLNKYQKIQLALLILIIIALILFVISIVKKKNSTNYVTEETFSEMTPIIEEKEEISNEDVNEVENSEDTSWDEEKVEDSQVDMSDEKNDEKSNGAKYYLKVNYTANVVTAYTKDSSGQYTVPAKAMVCSTGAATPTSGVYKMSDKYRWHQLNGGVYGQYCSRITGHILFHSVPYATNSPDSLKYTAYDKLGTKASAGCIRLTVADAMWVYSNCASGTYVEFYSSSDPGPLGKPSAQKISSNVTCRNWDPTDPISGNPWHTYTEPAAAEPEEPKKEENNQPEDNNNQNQEQNPSNENKGNDENNNNGDDNNNTQKPGGNETDNTSSNETSGNNTVVENTTDNVTTVNDTV